MYKRDFSKVSLGDLAVLWLMLNQSRAWEEEYFPCVLKVFAKDPKKHAASLMGVIEEELKSRGILVDGLK